jgi:hypothetical protein
LGESPPQIAWLHVVDPQGNDDTGGTLNERVAKLDPGASFVSEQISGTLMRSGDERKVFKWPKPADSSPSLAAWDKLNTTRFHLRASACYCSIFDECKITEFGMSHPKPVASCD